MVKKTYESEQITVQWDSSRCIHTAIWLRSLPEVFDVNRRPWIVLEGASAEAVPEAVMKCPSRVLKFSSPAISEPVDGPPTMRKSSPILAESAALVQSPDCSQASGNLRSRGGVAAPGFRTALRVASRR